MGRILIVEDESGMRGMLSIMLKGEGHNVETCNDGVQGIERVKDGDLDLVITDLKMPGADGIEVLKVAKRFLPAAQVIVATAFGTTENAVEAMKLGAYDYIQKPFKVSEIKVRVEKALEKGRLLTENIALKENQRRQYRLENIIGKSRVIRDLFQLIEKVAPTMANVLILGESGTGKELVARAVHGRSKRFDNPFVVVNCSAIPETLFESELFGHVKGAFTGAVVDKKGLFEVAHGGTIFFDEVADVPIPIQVKLLRVIQDRTFRNVGGIKDITVDVRIVAATNRNLEDEVSAGRFREDLYYRVKVVTIELPPLRDRAEDIPVLATHFLNRLALEQGKKITGFTAEAMRALETFHFKGNVRQLENMVERAVTLTEGGLIELQSVNTSVDAETREGIDFDREVARFERRLILRALEQAGGDRQRAAELLGLTMRSLRYRLAKYRLDAD
ncbi:MAG: sigma-54-dependent Fis family transcriptional regulator [Deltaproteobacteria bacterium]|nr:sigma-54-dependent Fis family transcriptional regulator [Deltaproteobacteria bacterium]